MDSARGYAKSGGAHLAYWALGGGVAMLYLSSFTVSIDSLDEEPHAAHYFRRLASFSRLIRFDARGVGLSDPIDSADPPTVASAARDVEAVLEACKLDRAVVVADAGASMVALELAATRPECVVALVVVNGCARVVADEDYPYGHPRELVERFLEQNMDPHESWSLAGDDDLALIAPSMQADPQFRGWWARAGARGASPASARAIVGMMTSSDVRSRLLDVKVPTLVIHRAEGRFVPVALGRYLRDNIAGARYVEFAGADLAPWTGGADEIVDEIEEFVTGHRSGSGERTLATVLFTDIVDSTGRAAALGDAAWRAYLDAHDGIVRSELVRYGGREINTTGDGFLGAFESPTQAVRCAQAIVRSSAAGGIAVRAGAHTGECERRGDDLAGLTVHIAARVAGLAASGEVLVSRTVRDLVAGSGVRFVDRGEHELRGVPESWQLFALES
ncbi:MAG: adenylate/guanylate cyclase domain-containing protein [Acidimicrobiales bacterium]